MELAECVVYADIVMDGSKESVNYVYCVMHYNKICNCRNQFQNLKSCKETLPAFCFLLLCSMCSQAQNITKISKTFRKIKKFKQFKMSVSAGNMSTEFKYEYYLIIKLQK